MTTIIYDYEQGTLSEENKVSLAKMYREGKIVENWQPGQSMPADALILSCMSQEVASHIDIAEEDLIHIDEAMELLQSDLSMSDVITHGNEIITQQSTPLQQLQLVISGIENLLADDQTPKHKKPALRCLKAILCSTQHEFSCVDEFGLTDEGAIKTQCAAAMRSIKYHIAFVSEYMEVWFHDQRSQQEEPTT